MSSKQIDVKCPCCSSVLTVDVLTGKIMRSVRADEGGASAAPSDRWQSAQDRVRQRTQGSADKLESALDAERGKEARFDELFKKASEKHARKPDEE
jgi:hypothetical protein